MKPITNWNEVKAPTEYVELPAGGYVCKIMGAKVETYSSRNGDSFEKLVVAIDIIEGDFANYYAENYRAQQGEKKWKGNISYYIPADDGSEKDEYSKRILKGFTEAVETSNTGYSWDWDENKLKGKKVGIIFRREEWAYNGKSGWRTAPFKAIDSTAAATGDFKMPADKPLANSPATAQTPSYSAFANANFEEVGNEEDLPF